MEDQNELVVRNYMKHYKVLSISKQAKLIDWERGRYSQKLRRLHSLGVRLPNMRRAKVDVTALNRIVDHYTK